MVDTSGASSCQMFPLDHIPIAPCLLSSHSNVNTFHLGSPLQLCQLPFRQWDVPVLQSLELLVLFYQN